MDTKKLSITQKLTSLQKIFLSLTVQEVALIGFAFGVAVVFAWLVPGAGVDLRYAYLPVAHDDLRGFYNPYWVRPFFELLSQLPFRIAYFSLMTLSILSTVAAVKIFGGQLIYVIPSYQFIYLLFYGQIDAFIVLGLALEKLATQKKRPYLFGWGALLSLLKPQISSIATLYLWLQLKTWKNRIMSLVPMVITFAISVLYYGWWLSEWIHHLKNNELSRLGSISLWEFIGPWASILWLPLLLKPCKDYDCLKLILATSALAMPYYQQHSLVTLQVLPIGPIAWIGNIGFLFYFLRWSALELTVLLPIAVYLRCLYRNFYSM